MIAEPPVARTKIRPPVRRGPLLDRPRLLNFLREHIDKTLILISAPAGYGKTALLVQFYHDTDLPVAWYSLNETDQNTHRFNARLADRMGEPPPCPPPGLRGPRADRGRLSTGRSPGGWRQPHMMGRAGGSAMKGGTAR